MKPLCYTLLCLVMLCTVSFAQTPDDSLQSTTQAQNAAKHPDQGISFFAFFDIGDVRQNEDSITKSEFQAILEELKNGEYNVLPLDKAVSLLKEGQKTAKPSVVLTFDGGYQSFYDNAWPFIKDTRLPVTIFITPEQIDRDSDYFMSWETLEDLADYDFVTLGLQADIYKAYPARTTQAITSGINRAIGRFKEKLGQDPTSIAYPYGLYDKQVLDIISQYEFIQSGFGLHSSVAYANENALLTLPRFPLAGKFGHIDRFRMLARALPLKVSDVVPNHTTMVSAQNPLIGFTLDHSLVKQRDKLSCFASDIGRIESEFLGENRVELRPPKAHLNGKRTRINCTLPYKDPVDGTQNWRWFGLVIQTEQTIKPNTDDFTNPTQPVQP